MATQSEIAPFLTQVLAKILKVKPTDINGTIAFDRFGLDSAGAFKMVGALNEKYGTDFEPTILYDHPTIDQLAAFLQKQLSA
jgi:acyl carrier protein